MARQSTAGWKLLSMSAPGPEQSRKDTFLEPCALCLNPGDFYLALGWVWGVIIPALGSLMEQDGVRTKQDVLPREKSWKHRGSSLRDLS